MSTIVRDNRQLTATIPANSSTSNTIAIAELAFGGVVVPAALTGTAISFSVSADNPQAGSPTHFQPLKREYDSAGTITTTAISIPVAGTEAFELPPELFNFTFFKFVSNGTEAAPGVFYLCSKG
jgi:hypothetical protein